MRFQPVKCTMMHPEKIQASYTLEGTVLENVECLNASNTSV